MKRVLLAVSVVALAVGYAYTRPVAGQAAGLKEVVRVPKCPSHAPTFTPGGGTSRHFVRPRASAVRLCRYYKVDWTDSEALWRHRLVTGGKVVSNLTHSFNRLKEPPRGIFCIKDNGSEMVLWFGYAGAKPERVVVKLSGCRFASNGKAVRSTTAHLHKRLLVLSRG